MARYRETLCFLLIGLVLAACDNPPTSTPDPATRQVVFQTLARPTLTTQVPTATTTPTPSSASMPSPTSSPGLSLTPSPEPRALVGSRAARDSALVYIADQYGVQALQPTSHMWKEEQITREGPSDVETFAFTSGEWVAMVLPVAASPGGLFYDVTIANQSIGFRWEGQVHAGDQITELAGPRSRRITTPDTEAADLVALVKGNNAFALDLYHLLRTEPGNLFYSPHSISQAVAMGYAGACGQTERQIAGALHYTLPQDQLPPAFNALDLDLARRGAGGEARNGETFRLNIRNALWAQHGFFLLPQFLDVLAEHYGAPLRLGDFASAPEESRHVINDWVREQTEGRIERLLPPGAISSWTRLVIVNTVYFNAAWSRPFKAASTGEGTFHLLDGGAVAVPMMSKQDWSYYTEGNGYRVVELPYDGRELSMVILVPEIAQFATFERSLDAERLDTILTELEWGLISLTMPKFEFASDFRLKEPLSRMGMAAAAQH